VQKFKYQPGCLKVNTCYSPLQCDATCLLAQYQSFEGTCCFHICGWSQYFKLGCMEDPWAEDRRHRKCVETFIFYSRSANKRQHILPKCWYPPTRLLTIMSEKTIFRIHTDMATSTLTCFLGINWGLINHVWSHTKVLVFLHQISQTNFPNPESSVAWHSLWCR
jgi:hypothetical protein